MLIINGLHYFYYLRGFHDMCCKYECVLAIIHRQLGRALQDGDMFMVINKDYRLISVTTNVFTTSIRNVLS